MLLTTDSGKGITAKDLNLKSDLPEDDNDYYNFIDVPLQHPVANLKEVDMRQEKNTAVDAAKQQKKDSLRPTTTI